MMIGHNELILNEATMREAVQYWLMNRIFNKDSYAPEVGSVQVAPYGNLSGQFLVTLNAGTKNEPGTSNP